MKFSVPVDTVKALLLAAAKSDVRYYLNAVCIDVRDSDAVAVATNGHILFALPIAPEGDAVDVPYRVGQYIIPRDVLEGLKPAYKGAPVMIELTATTVTVNTGGSATTAQLVDAKFPEWRKVIPRSVSGLVSQFDSELVAAFGKINKLLGAKYSPAILHNGTENGDGAAAIVSLIHGIGILMPMRCERLSWFGPESWADANPQPVAVAAVAA